MAYILGSWKLRWWELGAKLFVWQEVYETLLYLLAPFVLPISFIVRPAFCGYLTAATFGLYYVNVTVSCHYADPYGKLLILLPRFSTRSTFAVAMRGWGLSRSTSTTPHTRLYSQLSTSSLVTIRCTSTHGTSQKGEFQADPWLSSFSSFAVEPAAFAGVAGFWKC